MLTRELFIKLQQHMNLEYLSSGIYIATSSMFSEYGLFESAQISRRLAQYSVTRLMRFNEFLKKYQHDPCILQNVPFFDISELSMEDKIHELLFDYRARNHSISEIEKLSITTNSLVTKLFIEKIRPSYNEEAELLLSSFKDGVFLNKINEKSVQYKLSGIHLCSE
ncbi:hypothetical protein TUM17577_45070 [Enterobacter asburiae]|nr:hypothetical protein TUM17577_45070 [Enterobacter asburiae]